MSPPAAGRAPLDVTSTANPRVKMLVAMRRRRSREQSQLLIVDGYAEIVLALDAGHQPRALYFCEELIADDAQRRLIDRVGSLGADLVRVTSQVFARIAYGEAPDGWLAVLPTIEATVGSLHLSDNPLLLVCVAIEKPGNLGAMLRTADAAGLDAVVAADPVGDWGNPNLIRASKATVFSVPVASASSAVALAWLRERSIRVVATTPAASTMFTDIDYRAPAAVVVGSEKDGLPSGWLDEADDRVHIPMWGRVNSINVATSAAIVIYEAVRQRHHR